YESRAVVCADGGDFRLPCRGRRGLWSPSPARAALGRNADGVRDRRALSYVSRPRPHGGVLGGEPVAHTTGGLGRLVLCRRYGDLFRKPVHLVVDRRPVVGCGHPDTG